MHESKTPADALDRGRQAYSRQAWGEAYALLSAADRIGSVELEDVERLAIAAHMLGMDDDSIALLGRGHQEALRRRDVSRAARTAFWLAMQYLGRGETARAGGWLARAERVVEDDKHDRVERGYVLLAVAEQALAQGHAETAAGTYDAVAEIADRFADPDLATLARLGKGQALVALSERARGVALLDEAMVAVTAGEVSPLVVGIVYCSVIDTCHQLFDLRRAQEWTTALHQWCESQPELVPYRGQCLLHRAELMRFHGAWQEAADEANRARERLSQPQDEPALGEVLYQQGELHRLCGDYAKAEAAYRQASHHGRRPEPGLALLRLAQGRVDEATATIRRAADEAVDRLARPTLLDPYIEIMLTAGDVDAARVAADELSRIARDVGAPLLLAMADRAEGAVLLAEEDPVAGLAALRRAWRAWHSLGAPYEAARVRVLIGIACRALGDEETAGMEFDAARDVFRELGATLELARVVALSATHDGMSGGLTPRELEVLRLVAAGMSNKAIAADLVISDKTVARHLSNIFTKIGLSSRAGATAYAYDHHLLSSRT